MTKNDKTIFASSPNAKDLADMREDTATRLIEGLMAIAESRKVQEFELISDILLSFTGVDANAGAVDIIEKPMGQASKIPAGTLQKVLVKVARKGETRDQAVGFRLYLDNTLVAERIRTPASARLFDRRRKSGGDIKAGAANRFIANWMSPKIRAHGSRMGFRTRACDIMHACTNQVSHFALKGQPAYIEVSSLIDPSVLVRDTVAAPERAKIMVDNLQTYGWDGCKAIAKSLGIPVKGKKDALSAKITQALTVVSNGACSDARAEQVAEAYREVVS